MSSLDDLRSHNGSREQNEDLKHFRNVFDCISDGVIVSNPETGAILEANDRICEMLGYSTDELRNIDIGQLCSGEPPFTRTHALEIVDKAASGKPQTHEWHVRHRCGRLIWLEFSIYRAELGCEPVLVTVARDTTDRRRADEALRESEEKFRSVFDNAGAGMALVSPEGAFTKLNRAFCDFLGYEEEELVGMTVEAVTHPEDREDSRTRMRVMLEGGPNISHLQKRYLRKDGSPVWGEVCVTTVRNCQGMPKYMIAQVMDVTERRLAEQKSLQAAAEADRYFEVVPDMVCVAGTDGTFKKLNHAWEKTLGYSVKELLHTPFIDLVHPDDVQNTLEQVQKQVQGQGIAGFTNPLQVQGRLVPLALLERHQSA